MNYYLRVINRSDEPDDPATWMDFEAGDSEMHAWAQMARRLKTFLSQGFSLVRFDQRPTFFKAERSDGTRLDIMLIERDAPIVAGQVYYEKGDDHAAV